MARMDYGKAAPGAMRAMYGLERYIRETGLEPSLRELVRLRVSQINGCAYCVDMHYKDARALGESEQRLYGLVAWREMPWYTERERAAFAWAEALTLISTNHVPDELYEQVRQHFTEEELTNLTLVIVTINGWNRFGISFRDDAGTYEPAENAKAK